jgi:hypothetical protein
VGMSERMREKRAALTTRESVATLDYMEDFFSDSSNWTQGVYSTAAGARCLVGAAEHARVSCVDDARHWLQKAVAERAPHWTIEQYNDNCRNPGEIVTIIRRAKELAGAAQLPAPRPAALPAPAPVLTGEVLPPASPRWPAPVPASRPAPVVIDATPRRQEPPRVRAPQRRSLFWDLLGE